MYATCIFCSGPLGANEALETFPVGSRIAFDARRGRLWAVCPRCSRWNLAPIEERWEAVEQAERLFTDTRSRVQSQNIGLARLPDGTRLIRVGEALPGELAAWRYGPQLVSRRNRNLLYGGATALAGGAVIAGLPVVASAGVPLVLLTSSINVAAQVAQVREQRRIVHRIAASESPVGREIIVRRSDLFDATLHQLDGGGFGIRLPEVPPARVRRWSERLSPERPAVQLTGDPARQVVARALVTYNRRGAREREIRDALGRIEQAGGADAFAYLAAASGAVLARNTPYSPRHSSAPSLKQVLGTFRGEVLPVRKYRSPFVGDDRPRLDRHEALALEIALQEEAERRALEGELAALEAAWREAEEIARIADALPDELTEDRLRRPPLRS